MRQNLLYGVIAACAVAHIGCSDAKVALCDPSAIDPCAPGAGCVEAPEGAVCICDDGFAGDGTVCSDVNECADQTDNCDPAATCTNNDGGFTCDCPPSHLDIDGDGTTCERFEVVGSTPPSGSVAADPTAAITVTFSHPIDDNRAGHGNPVYLECESVGMGCDGRGRPAVNQCV